MTQGTKRSTHLETIPWFCTCSQLQLEIDISVSVATADRGNVLILGLGWTYFYGSREMPTSLVLFFCLFTTFGCFSFLPDREKWLDLCFGCHREVYFMSNIFWLFLFLFHRQGRFYLYFVLLIVRWLWQDNFEEMTLADDSDDVTLMRWIWWDDFDDVTLSLSDLLTGYVYHILQVRLNI